MTGTADHTAITAERGVSRRGLLVNAPPPRAERDVSVAEARAKFVVNDRPWVWVMRCKLILRHPGISGINQLSAGGPGFGSALPLSYLHGRAEAPKSGGKC